MGVVEPVVPAVRHVWVHTHGRHGSPSPAVVVSWHPAVYPGTVNTLWTALVAVRRAEVSHCVEFVPADLLDITTDDRPAGKPGRRGVAHAWTAPSYRDGKPDPALITDWRRGAVGWEALTAIVHDGFRPSLFVTWTPVAQVRPIRDDMVRSPGSAGELLAGGTMLG